MVGRYVKAGIGLRPLASSYLFGAEDDEKRQALYDNYGYSAGAMHCVLMANDYLTSFHCGSSSNGIQNVKLHVS